MTKLVRSNVLVVFKNCLFTLVWIICSFVCLEWNYDYTVFLQLVNFLKQGFGKMNIS